jgi:ABC-type polysaccharide/polyol phosphate transport system ATPase subunit
MSDDVLVKVDNVSKRFCRSLKRSLWYGLQDLGSEIGGHRHGGGSGLPQSSADVQLRPDEFWAVKDLSFELRRGECLGLIGRNGAGKTTLLRMLNGLIKPDTGRIEMQGKIGALIALGAGFNPVLTGRENILINASILGLESHELTDEIERIIDFSEIGYAIDSPVQSYSSGMQARLGFAAASFMRPDVLLVDEVLAVGDRQFQMKCFNRLGENIKDGSCVILVSHSDHHIARMTSKCLYLKNGSIAYFGKTIDSLGEYKKDDITIRPSQVVSGLVKRQIASNGVSFSICVIKLVKDTKSSLSFNIFIEAASNSTTGNSQSLWLEFLIRDLDERPLTYWHQELEINSTGNFCVNIDFPCLYLNKAYFSVSCALWSADKTFIYDSSMHEFATTNYDAINIGDFRSPALVSVNKSDF